MDEYGIFFGSVLQLGFSRDFDSLYGIFSIMCFLVVSQGMYFIIRVFESCKVFCSKLNDGGLVFIIKCRLQLYVDVVFEGWWFIFVFVVCYNWFFFGVGVGEDEVREEGQLI